MKKKESSGIQPEGLWEIFKKGDKKDLFRLIGIAGVGSTICVMNAVGGAQYLKFVFDLCKLEAFCWQVKPENTAMAAALVMLGLVWVGLQYPYLEKLSEKGLELKGRLDKKRKN